MAGPALIGALGGLGNLLLGRSSAKQQQGFNAREAQKQRDFEERMSNTQYQRAMSDMRTAGLNPMLAFEQGGAGTPGGAAASGSAADIGGVASSALAGAKLIADLKVASAQADALTQKGMRDKTERDKTAAYWLNSSNTIPRSEDLRPLMAKILDSQREAAQASARSARANAFIQELQVPAARVHGNKWMEFIRHIPFVASGAKAF